uniref:Uncharacterized protein n=1 Tax=Anguilla anguilla TaxID=7936 RepID=A0A0E9XXD0_ANGAN
MIFVTHMTVMRGVLKHCQNVVDG